MAVASMAQRPYPRFAPESNGSASPCCCSCCCSCCSCRCSCCSCCCCCCSARCRARSSSACRCASSCVWDSGSAGIELVRGSTPPGYWPAAGAAQQKLPPLAMPPRGSASRVLRRLAGRSSAPAPWRAAKLGADAETGGPPLLPADGDGPGLAPRAGRSRGDASVALPVPLACVACGCDSEPLPAGARGGCMAADAMPSTGDCGGGARMGREGRERVARIGWRGHEGACMHAGRACMACRGAIGRPLPCAIASRKDLHAKACMHGGMGMRGAHDAGPARATSWLGMCTHAMHAGARMRQRARSAAPRSSPGARSACATPRYQTSARTAAAARHTPRRPRGTRPRARRGRRRRRRRRARARRRPPASARPPRPRGSRRATLRR